MAFPKLLQKLFQNNGAGTKLRSEILPDIPYSSITGAPTTDSALSATSTNPVQNKVIKAAIDSVSTSVLSSGYQVGDLRLYAGTDVPDGWFRCDGSTIADMATNYPKLYGVLGTNVLPNSSGMCLQGATSGIGTNVSAGLPNIEGVFYGFNAGTSGAFRHTEDANVISDSAKWGGRSRVTFDASRSNSIYGSSTTVQPSALKVAVLIKHD